MSRPLLFIFLIAFGIGIATGEVLVIPMIALATAAASAIACLSFRKTVLVGIAVLGIALGAWRTQVSLQAPANDISRFLNQTITLTGDVVLPSTISGTAQKFELTDLTTTHQQFTGKLLVSVPAIPEILPGSRVRVSCAITELTAISQRRQWSHGIHARCATLDVKIIGSVTSWRATLGKWQEQLLSYVRHNFNEPQASLLNGILIGNTDGMPDYLNQDFQITGTTHIVALSGFNVTIIMALVVNWLIRIVGRRWAWIPALVLLIAFVIMSGASASVMRAAIMAIIVQMGLFIGRPISIGRLLGYTILLMAWVNPLVVFHDLGCQLSFLATVGLVTLSKPLQRAMPWVSEKVGLRENLATTLSAIIMTEPLLLWRFGRISLVAPLVNLFVVPLIPLSMGVGSLFLLGMWVPLWAALTVPVNDALLRLIVWFITFGASLPQSLVYVAPYVAVIGGISFVWCALWLQKRYAR